MDKNFTELFQDQLNDLEKLGCEEFLFVCHQHVLPSLQPQFEFIITHLCSPENVFILGKPYSTIHTEKNYYKSQGINYIDSEAILIPGDYVNCIKSDISALWDSVRRHHKIKTCSKIIILDEGGYLVNSIPSEFIGIAIAVEQTEFGSRKINSKIPVVQVSVSAAKKIFESKIIIDGVWARLVLEKKLDFDNVYGVIGLGYLGCYLAAKLLENGYKVVGYDVKKPSLFKLDHICVQNTQQLIDESSVIFGCTGVDAIPVDSTISKDLELISISSADIEFSGLLDKYHVVRNQIHDLISIRFGANVVTISNGGFPYNFDGITEYEEYSEILLTRLLMLGGIMQALVQDTKVNRSLPLDPKVQKNITHYWYNNFSNSTYCPPDSLKWWEEKSSILFMPEKNMIEKKEYKLHSTTPVYLDLVRSHKEPYTFTLNGEKILILPGVMSPKYDWAGHYMIENLPELKGLDVLEIGSGSGLVSMAAFRAGAKRVVATDINKKAVENTRLNFSRIGAEDQCEAIYSDMFENVTGIYDVVIFNAPYHGCKANDDLEKGVADENYEALKGFFGGVKSFIKLNSTIVVGFSSSGDHDLFDDLSVNSGLRLIKSVEDIREGYQCEIHTFKMAN